MSKRSAEPRPTDRAPRHGSKRGPHVTAVVLNYNRAQDTVECVASLKKSKHRNLDVIVVDNGSTDASGEIFRRKLSGVKILMTGKNLGFAAGNNEGIRFAFKRGADYVLVLNNDTIVERDALTELVGALEQDKTAAGATGIICSFPAKDRIWYGGGDFVRWRVAGFTRKVGDLYEPAMKNSPEPVTFMSGCMMLLRTSVLKNVGLFDERFFMYHEDAELSMRLVSAGYRLLYVPASRIYHKAVHLGDTPFHMYYSVRNRFLLAQQTTTGAVRLVGKAYYCAAIGFKMLVWFVTRRDLFRAAWLGLVDYRRNVFHEGRGLNLVGEGGNAYSNG
ncbi:MAG: glycosyltransferase family 2 protein [Bacteroidota bacterium]